MVDGYTETLPISFYTTIKNYINKEYWWLQRY
jgi:hypothetical protein